MLGKAQAMASAAAREQLLEPQPDCCLVSYVQLLSTGKRLAAPVGASRWLCRVFGPVVGDSFPFATS